VSLVLNLVANGTSFDDIFQEYPSLEQEDIQQSLKYALHLASEEDRSLSLD
jgi:uncharacterized protein (DUF433 family)